MHNPERRRTV